MANRDALAQLKDIHLPDPVGWWPLAPGWYGLMILIFIMVVWIVAMLYKRNLNARPKKHALALLHTYTIQYEKDHNAQQTSALISELLKRVALVYFPRHRVASMHGEAWIDFLNQTSKGINFEPVKTMLLDSPFKHNEQVNLKPLITRTELWIKQRKVSCSK